MDTALYLFRFDAIRRIEGSEPEIVRYLHHCLPDVATAVATAGQLLSSPDWPKKADAIRVIDDDGREVLRRAREAS
jgi:hypothetical protein